MVLAKSVNGSAVATPSKKGDPQPEITHTVNTFPTAFFLWYWGLASLAAFSKAGEKMPWLTVHIQLANGVVDRLVARAAIGKYRMG